MSNNGQVWHDFLPQYVDAHVTALMQEQANAEGTRKFKVSRFRKGCMLSDYFDRFCVSFGYCGSWVRVDVIYQAFYPTFCPDFIFDEGEEVDIEELKSLQTWDATDYQSLVRVIKEIMQKHRENQHRRVKECTDDQVQFEHSMLGQFPGIDFQLIEKDGDATFVCYAPIELAVGKEGKASCYVYIARPGRPGSKAVVRVDIPPSLRSVLAGFQQLAWTPEMSVGGYLFDTKAMMEELVKTHNEVIVKRKRFIQALMERFGTALEFDSTDFSRVTFFFNYDKVKPLSLDVTLHVSMPAEFPQLAPKVALQSLLYTRGGKPIVKSVVDYPYSPRWRPEEMAQRLGAFLTAILQDFKTTLITSVAPPPAAAAQQYQQGGSPVGANRPNTAPGRGNK